MLVPTAAVAMPSLPLLCAPPLVRGSLLYLLVAFAPLAVVSVACTRWCGICLLAATCGGFEMSDDNPTFHAPVRFPLAGGIGDARAALLHHDFLPAAGALGTTVVRPDAPDSRCRGVASPLGGRLKLPVAAGRASAGRRMHRPRPRTAAPRSSVVAASGGADDVGDEYDDAAVVGDSLLAPPQRVSRAARPDGKLLVEDYIQDALIPCLRRACGLPLSEVVRQRVVPVTAKIVGDNTSSSRAIVLRCGAGKKDVSIMWVSRRGGLLCSFFAGTQNALFLSASSRSSECSHTAAVNAALCAASIPTSRFRSRMQLKDGATDCSNCSAYGASLLWTVLYRSVFSVVSFSPGNVATCIAPGCRRFRRRCGHVQVSRDAQKRLGVTGYSGLPPDVTAKPKKLAAGARRSRFLQSEEEDDGVEQLPSDTIRDENDSATTSSCDCLPRNMFPCRGELLQGEAWNRTADWRSLYIQRARGPPQGRQDDLNMMQAVMSSGARRDLFIDSRRTLVEARCGSCGQKRLERHVVIEEPALLPTHHPTAPAIKVSHHLLALAGWVPPVLFAYATGSGPLLEGLWIESKRRTNHCPLLLLFLMSCFSVCR